MLNSISYYYNTHKMCILIHGIFILFFIPLSHSQVFATGTNKDKWLADKCTSIFGEVSQALDEFLQKVYGYDNRGIGNATRSEKNAVILKNLGLDDSNRERLVDRLLSAQMGRLPQNAIQLILEAETFEEVNSIINHLIGKNWKIDLDQTIILIKTVYSNSSDKMQQKRLLWLASYLIGFHLKKLGDKFELPLDSAMDYFSFYTDIFYNKNSDPELTSVAAQYLSNLIALLTLNFNHQYPIRMIYLRYQDFIQNLSDRNIIHLPQQVRDKLFANTILTLNRGKLKALGLFIIGKEIDHYEKHSQAYKYAVRVINSDLENALNTLARIYIEYNLIKGRGTLLVSHPLVKFIKSRARETSSLAQHYRNLFFKYIDELITLKENNPLPYDFLNFLD